MSCVDAAEKVSEPSLGKVGKTEKADVKNGNPCIDFQPDESWQIKEEPTAEAVPNSKNKDVACSNGRRSLRLRSSSAKARDSVVANGEAGESESDSESVKSSSKSAKGESDNKINAKRKLTESSLDSSESLEDVVDKKMKVETSEDTGVKEQADSSKDGKLPQDDTEIKVESVDDTEIKVESVDDTEIKVESVSSPKPSSNEDDKPNETSETETAGKEDEVVELSLEESKTDAQSDKGADDDIEIINVNDDSKKSDEESDSEIQILEQAENPVFVAPPMDTTSIESSASTPTNVCLTAGFPYYNSLKEKIKNFKAGEYKPVKFPHTGTLLLAENEVIIESPSLLVPLLIKESDEFPRIEGSSEKKVPEANASMLRLNMISKRNFFQSSVGQFLINLGTSRVQEWYHRDMKRAKLKQLKSNKATEEDLESAVALHEKRHKELITTNAVFNFRMLQCKFCGFKSESMCVMEGHYLTPHVSPRREYKCNFCQYLTRNPEEIVFHFEAMHNKKAILEPEMSFLHECIFCSFQTNLKTKVNVHMNRCRKHFIPNQNLAPPFDFEFPGVTTKPVTIADVVGHKRLLLSSSKNRMPVPEDSSSALARKKLASVLSKLSGPNAYSDPKATTLMSQLMKTQNQIPGLSSTSNIQLPPGIVITRPRSSPLQQMSNINRYPSPRGQQPMRGPLPRRGPPFTTNLTSTAANLAQSGISITPITRASLLPRSNPVPGIRNVTLTPIGTASNRTVSQKPGAPQPVALFTNMAGSPGLVGQPQARLPVNVNLRTLRPAPPYQRLNTPPSQVVKGSSGNTFVVCEICDSYIKDLEELRTHMNYVHKVKIHPKMLVSRPPLNCQKCQWRFFTDQGLERHLLGAHGLVTTNMQEMANKNQDGGRCIICGAVFTYKLVSHMTQVHKVTLKPAHLSYKCTVCTATFTLYRLFESHVYNVHSGSAKRPAEEPSPAAAAEPPAKKVAEDPGPKRCKGCNVITANMEQHLIATHMKRCSVKLCRIEKCKKCLYSSDEMIVIRMSDFGLDSEEDESGDDDESESSAGEEDDNDSG